MFIFFDDQVVNSAVIKIISVAQKKVRMFLLDTPTPLIEVYEDELVAQVRLDNLFETLNTSNY